VTLDLDEDTYFVLTKALGDFAERQRAEAEHDEASAQSQLRWAAAADAARERVEASL
jgi:hypothetical protein